MTPEFRAGSSPSVIELIGMPGSGKSTVAKYLFVELEKRQIPTLLNAAGSAQPESVLDLPRYRRRLNKVRTLTSQPMLTLSMALRSTSRKTRAELLRLMIRELRRQDLNHVSEDVVILDEGPLHKLCTIYADAQVTRPQGLAKHLTSPSLCVALEIDTELALERVQGRTPNSPVDSKPREDLVRYLRRYAEFQTDLMDHLPCPIISIDSSQEGANIDLADALVGYLDLGR